MSEILTLEETQELHKELWTWIAEKSRERKRQVYKSEFFHEMNHCFDSDPKNFCWCCEFSAAVKNVLDISFCKCCPVKNWQSKGKDYPCETGLYESWRKASEIGDWKKAADLAKLIANLPFRKAFDITPEQAKLLRDKGYGEIYSVEEV